MSRPGNPFIPGLEVCDEIETARAAVAEEADPAEREILRRVVADLEAERAGLLAAGGMGRNVDEENSHNSRENDDE